MYPSLRVALFLPLLLPGLALAQGPPPRPPGPPGAPPHAAGDWGPPAHVLDEVRQREAEIMAWVQANDPESATRLQELKRADPRGYIGQLVRVARMMDRASEDPAVVERYKRIRELEIEVREQVADYDSLDPKAQRERKKAVTALVGELFELRQEERKSTLQELQRKMDELREEIDQREGPEKDKIIDDYVDQLLRGPVDL